MDSRISTMADEMRVFVDRSITRLAEMQAESAEKPAHFAQAAERTGHEQEQRSCR